MNEADGNFKPNPNTFPENQTYLFLVQLDENLVFHCVLVALCRNKSNLNRDIKQLKELNACGT